MPLSIEQLNEYYQKYQEYLDDYDNNTYDRFSPSDFPEKTFGQFVYENICN